MKILQLTNKVPWPPKEGGTIAVFTLSKGFFLNGHQVTVLAMNTEEKHFEPGIIPEHLAAEINFIVIDVPFRAKAWSVWSNFIFSSLPYHAKRFIHEEYSMALIRLLKENEFDVIQLEGLYLCPYISLIRRYSRAVISYRVHNIEHEIEQHNASMIGGLNAFFRVVEAKRLRNFELSFLNEYDVLVSITERDGMIWDKLGNTKPRYTSRTGIDLSTLIPTAKELEYPSLFYIGALDWPPNQKGLIWFFNHCWPDIRRKFPDLRCYIAGRNAPVWLESRLHAENIDFIGEVDDAYRFMCSKAIMVVPVLSGSGIRINIIEGMALGKAVVSTSVGCEGIPAIDHDNILIGDTPEAFVKAVGELVSNKALFDKLCKTSVDFIREKFDNLAIVGSLIRFYETYLEKPEHGLNRKTEN